jgi:hypothetical protein
MVYVTMSPRVPGRRRVRNPGVIPLRPRSVRGVSRVCCVGRSQERGDPVPHPNRPLTAQKAVGPTG